MSRFTNLAVALLLAYFLAIVFWVAYDFARPRPVRYDCSMVEYTPDTPAEIRKQCRRVRA